MSTACAVISGCRKSWAPARASWISKATAAWTCWLVQGGPLAGRGGADLPGDRLYRNVTEDGELRFVDVTTGSGVAAKGYGMGIATGDIDGDGDLDVFLANYGANQLYENLGDGRFRDVTAISGLTGTDWSVSASFADYDGDGKPDLFVANYVVFDMEKNRVCRFSEGRPTYCAPQVYPPSTDRLYRNVGQGRFVDVTAASGIARARGAGLGVIAEDFNGDGETDFYVANDGGENRLWLNQGDGTFADNALLAGAAINLNGKAEASMGVAAADFDADCDVDLFMTHLAMETNTLYVNDGGGWFTDLSNLTGIAGGSLPFTGFGTAWFDADNNGDLDLFSANGAVKTLPEQFAVGVAHPLMQLNQIWLNDGAGRYHEVDGGPAFQLEEVSRGAAFGDLDNDGDIDIVVTNNFGPVRLYRNDTARRHWLGLELAGGIGSRVRLAAESCGFRLAATDGSYASASDSRLVFGLNGDNTAQAVRVRWAGGGEEVFGPLGVDRYHRLVRGTGRAP